MASRTRRTKYQVELADSVTEEAEKTGDSSMTAVIKALGHLGENGLESVDKHATKIHLIDGEKGGVGKSLFARVLIQYFMDKKYPFLAVDADRSNPDVSRIYESVCRSALFSEDEKKFFEADKIFEWAFENSVIVNLPAQVYPLVTNWIEKNNLIELGKQSKISFCKWFVCTGGYDSVQLFLKSVQHFEKRIAHVLVRNCGLEDDWSSVEEMEEVQNAVKKYEVKVIDFPKFYSRERNAIDARGITFELARNSQEFGVLGRQRIKSFILSAYEAFETTGILP
ncbi:mobilization protein [[Phormidium ambiguum] IAM M-71]|uniref:mobilization protein n=1 Tax=[Phormidium ambiguum] IAM M-71 TaxID=454136 RepID=UPI000ADA1989|nr:mobilization protein [Phormidium ambiguum]